MWDLEHPDITCALRTGYGLYNQPIDEALRCDNCGDVIDDDEFYEDEFHECLCLECLKSLHSKGW